VKDYCYGDKWGFFGKESCTGVMIYKGDSIWQCDTCGEYKKRRG